MIYLIAAAITVIGGISYAGWQHGFWGCQVEQYLFGGLGGAADYGSAAGLGCSTSTLPPSTTGTFIGSGCGGILKI